jgi:peptidylprolyl isomerase domain and WD repeat-containing protein 1
MSEDGSHPRAGNRKRPREDEADETATAEEGVDLAALPTRRENDTKGSKSMEIDEDDDEFGPVMPTGPGPAKKRKTLAFAKLYLDLLPNAEKYEKSYMHRDVVTHVVSTKTEFIITGSADGHIKFWKKQPVGVEFVKHFRSHLGMYIYV